MCCMQKWPVLFPLLQSETCMTGLQALHPVKKLAGPVYKQQCHSQVAVPDCISEQFLHVVAPDVAWAGIQEPTLESCF